MITLEEIHNLIEQAKQTKLDCPVCIPSYKFRNEAWLVRNLHTIDAKVYLFVYEDDYTESGYSEFNWPDNVTMVKIREQDFKDLNIRWRGIQPKRRYIQLYMKNLNIEKYFMIDDDFVCGLYPFERRNNNCKSLKMKEFSINDLLKTIYYYKNNYCKNCNILGIDLTQYITFTQIFKGFKKEKHVCGIYFFDNCPILFRDKLLHEDTDLIIRSLDKCIFGIIDFLSVKINCRKETTVKNNHDELYLNDFIEYPYYIRLKYDKEKNTIKSYINVYNFKNRLKNYDVDLYNIVLTKNFDKIKNYLTNNKIGIEEW